MPFEWFVALRWLREGRMQTALILAGVAVGVGVIIFLAALIDGLQRSLIERTLGYQAHIIVRPQEEMPRPLAGAGDGGGDRLGIDHGGGRGGDRLGNGDPARGSLDAGPPPALAVRIEKPAQRLRSINQWPLVLAAIEQLPGVTAASPIAAGAAFAGRGAASRTVALRDIDPARFDRIVDVAGRLRAGRYDVAGTNAVIGAGLAGDLGAAVGDKVRVATAEGRSEIFTVAGIFDLENQDVNDRWVLVALPVAQTLLDLSGGVSTIEAKVARVFEAERLAGLIADRTGLVAESWMTLNAQLLLGLRSQNSSRYLIQAFVVIAVALGIASVLVVWVVQKNREIGILRATGTSRRQIRRIFLIQGGLLGLGGWVLGAGLGSGLSLLFASLAVNPDGTPQFPVALEPRLFAGTALLALAVGLLSAMAPARRAAALDPAVVIHHG